MLTLAIDLVLIGVHDLGPRHRSGDGLAHQFDGSGVQLIVVVEPTEVFCGDLLEGAVLRGGDSAVPAANHDDSWIVAVFSLEVVEEGGHVWIGGAVVAHDQLPVACRLLCDAEEAFVEETHRRVEDRNYHGNGHAVIDRVCWLLPGFGEPGFVLLADIAFPPHALQVALDTTGTALRTDQRMSLGQVHRNPRQLIS